MGNSPTIATDRLGLLDDLSKLPEQLFWRGNSPKGRAEGYFIGQAIQNTFDNNNPFYMPRFRDQRRKGYYCYEWAYAFEDAFNAESSGKYWKATVQSASSGELIHFWIKITSLETGQSIYVDDGFVDGNYVHCKQPIPKGWQIGNPGDMPRSESNVPPAYNRHNQKVK